MTDVLPFLLLALLGAAHCAGMCGGFAIALAGTAERRRALALRQVGLLSGKALTYAALGGLAAVAGTAIEGQGLNGFRSFCASMAGLALIVAGLAACGIRLPSIGLFHGPRWTALATRFRSSWRSLGVDGGVTGTLAAGAMMGMLPCGLSWSALALAASSPVPVAVVGMLLFGLGTAPALLAVALGWHGLAETSRRRLSRLAGPALILFGLVTWARALEEDTCPACLAAETAEPVRAE